MFSNLEAVSRLFRGIVIKTPQTHESSLAIYTASRIYPLVVMPLLNIFSVRSCFISCFMRLLRSYTLEHQQHNNNLFVTFFQIRLSKKIYKNNSGINFSFYCCRWRCFRVLHTCLKCGIIKLLSAFEFLNKISFQ